MIPKTRKYLLTMISLALILLWLPVSLDKLWNFQAFKTGILRQPLPTSVAWTLVYSVPLLELAIVILLVLQYYHGLSKSTTHDSVWNKWYLNPYLLSTLLLSAFSGYIAIALMGAWDKLPCGCGSIIAGLSWGEHLGFNMVFLSISILGLYLFNSIRRSPPIIQTIPTIQQDIPTIQQGIPSIQSRHTDRSGGISRLRD